MRAYACTSAHWSQTSTVCETSAVTTQKHQARLWEMLDFKSFLLSETNIWLGGRKDEKSIMAVRVCGPYQTTHANPPTTCLEGKDQDCISGHKSVTKWNKKCGFLPHAPFPLHIGAVLLHLPCAVGLCPGHSFGKLRHLFQHCLVRERHNWPTHSATKRESTLPFRWKQN